MVTVIHADLGNPAHAAGIVDCIDAYARDLMGGGVPLSDEVRQRLIPGLRAAPSALVLLAEVDGEMAGVAVCFMGFSTFAAKPRLNLHDLSVLPAFRGRGVGRALLDAVAQRAQTAGCSSVTLEVRRDNDTARQLYQSSGFRDGFAPMDFWEKKL